MRSRKRTASEKEEVFWSRVNKETETECWLWIAAKSRSGYGNFYNQGAHRYAYQFAYGDIPKGMVVMHSCDIKLCVNPKHLSIGTHKDNSQDMVRKGRCNSPVGERQGNSRLTEEQVRYIRANYIPGVNQNIRGNTYIFAEMYGLPIGTIRNVIQGDSWKHLEMEKQ
jgi:hypothetical protein